MSGGEILLKSTDSFKGEVFANNEKLVRIFRIATSDGEGIPEMHENYTDIFIFQEGKEEFFVGGDLAGKKSIGPGEWQGESLSGARKYLLEAGNILIVPKGVPHQHGKGVMKALVIKISNRVV